MNRGLVRSKVELLAAASIVAVCSSSAAFAQETSTTQGVTVEPAPGGAASPSAEASEEIVVTGIRGAQQRAVAIKRNAPSVVDSISAEDIGRLPDVTIADSLQRVPGVQIRREAGEGGRVNVRGLPQVATQLNGEEFLAAGSITNVQPNFGDIPSQLFAGADVIKSTTADLLNAGITGTINLRTRRPFDLKRGFTAAATAEAQRGNKTKSWDPQFNALAGFRGDDFGVLFSGAYSNVDLYNAQTGIQRDYGGAFHSEDYANATGYGGFRFGGGAAGRGTPVGGTAAQPAGYDVNGDGDINDVFFNPQAHTGWERITSRKRIGFNTSFQARLSDAFEFVGDAFFTKQTQYDRTAGFQFQSVNWQGAEYVPAAFRDTGAQVNGRDFYTVQAYDYDLPNFDSYSETIRTKSKSRNFNAELRYDDGGPLTATLRGIVGKASQDQDQSYLQFNLSNFAQWNGGIGHYPASLGGDRPFNPGGYAVNTLPALVDYSGSNVRFDLPAQLANGLDNIGSYALKTMSSENNYRRDADFNVLRLDGRYEFSDRLNLTFGARRSDRDADNYAFERAAPLYAGLASQPGGCLVKWKAADVQLNDPSCFARDANGFFTAGITRPANDPSFNGAVRRFDMPVGGVGSIYVLDPKAMDDAVAFQDQFYPGQVEAVLPGRSYGVGVKQLSGYAQANFEADVGVPMRGNFGLRVVNTKLDINQNITGPGRAYGVGAEDIGDINTKRKFTDLLPSVNVSFDVRDDVKIRAAYSKTMTLLDLNQWGGGLDVNYAIDTTFNPPIFRVTGGNAQGSPDLEPWRASNFDLSFEWYTGRASLISLAFFYVDVESFIENGTVVRTDLPDLDGVVRGRAVTINTPVQGDGGTLKGFELGVRQAFDFLSGVWRNFGIDGNLTYAPSKSGRKDLAGASIPFQDNSKLQTNFALWYQDSKFQARIAHNYRSKRAEQADFAGQAGFQLYQAPTHYVDASVSYDLTPNFTLYAQGSNLTKEYERYYLVWKDQKAFNNIYERRLMFGARAKF